MSGLGLARVRLNSCSIFWGKEGRQQAAEQGAAPDCLQPYASLASLLRFGLRQSVSLSHYTS